MGATNIKIIFSINYMRLLSAWTCIGTCKMITCSELPSLKRVCEGGGVWGWSCGWDDDNQGLIEVVEVWEMLESENLWSSISLWFSGERRRAEDEDGGGDGREIAWFSLFLILSLRPAVCLGRRWAVAVGVCRVAAYLDVAVAWSL